MENIGCISGHDDRLGSTSEEKCTALQGCCYTASNDHCENCPRSGGGGGGGGGDDDDKPAIQFTPALYGTVGANGDDDYDDDDDDDKPLRKVASAKTQEEQRLTAAQQNTAGGGSVVAHPPHDRHMPCSVSIQPFRRQAGSVLLSPFATLLNFGCVGAAPGLPHADAGVPRRLQAQVQNHKGEQAPALRFASWGAMVAPTRASTITIKQNDPPPILLLMSIQRPRLSASSACWLPPCPFCSSLCSIARLGIRPRFVSLPATLLPSAPRLLPLQFGNPVNHRRLAVLGRRPGGSTPTPFFYYPT